MQLVDISKLELFLLNKEKAFLIDYALTKAGIKIEPVAKIPEIKDVIIKHFKVLNKDKEKEVEDPVPDIVHFYRNTKTGFIFNATEQMRGISDLRPCDQEGNFT